MMNADIQTFLNSDLLERYLIGQTSPEETRTVENHIENHPEVANAYQTLQNKLELVSFANAEDAPSHILDSILEELDTNPVVALHSKRKKSWFNFSIAASIAALIFAGSSVFLLTKNLELQDENQVIVEELFDIRSDLQKNNDRLEALALEFKQLNNPETEKYILKGNRRAKNLKTVAYINPKEKTSMIDVVTLPTLPPEQCYQIWGDIQGKMVSLGILSETDRRLQKLNYSEGTKGLSITIEPKGGSLKATNETPVAEIEFNTHQND
ncbi:MAG: anti-sigma factor domain-containing protein [Bizionia paragorgiae]|uniref:anti-sigma factor domain-containing protein n=1 Tax=Bizionia paragorgiae TaxID=283786 RepID=UPI003C460EFB